MNNKMMMLGFWTMSMVLACQGGALSSKEALKALQLQRSLINRSTVSPESKITVLTQLQEAAKNIDIKVSQTKEKQLLCKLEIRLQKDIEALETPREKPGRILEFDFVD